jgi:hypothetical protein
VEIITRGAWRAQHENGFGPAPLPADRVWLHHSVTSAGGPGSSLAVDTLSVRQLEAIGETRFGKGISYTFAVTPSGRVFEGHSVDRKGAHTGGDNTHSRAIVLVGNMEVERNLTGLALGAVAELLVFGHARGWWRTPALTGGHRDAPTASTACPGRYAYAAIAGVNLAARRLAAGQTTTQSGDEHLNPDEHEQLRAVHQQETKPLDYRHHHCSPEDNQYGHTLATRRELHELHEQTAAQLAEVLQLLRARPDSGGPLGG